MGIFSRKRALTTREIAYVLSDCYYAALQHGSMEVEENGDVVSDEDGEPLYNLKDHLEEYKYLFAFLVHMKIKNFFPAYSNSIIGQFNEYLEKNDLGYVLKIVPQYNKAFDDAEGHLDKDSPLSNPIYCISKLAASRLSEKKTADMRDIIMFTDRIAIFVDFLKEYLKAIKVKQ